MVDMMISKNSKDQLTMVHPLSDMDQSVSRKYVRRMFIFDFPDQSKARRVKATSALLGGLQVAFKTYPHMTGRVGPGLDDLRDLVMLRYGHTDATRKITQDMFRTSYRKKATEEYSYKELAQMNMPVSHWKQEDFCIAPLEWEKEDWIPAVTMKATFLGSGGLVLCFAFHHSLVDGRSTSMFIETFAMGVRNPSSINEVKEYVQYGDLTKVCDFDLDEMDHLWNSDCFPEWDFDQRKPLYPWPHSGRCRLIKFPARVLSEVRQMCIAFLVVAYDTEKPYISSVDVLSALVWVSLIRARHTRFNRDDYQKPAVFSTTVDLRRQDSDELIPQRYFGNMFMNLAVTHRTVGDIVHPERTFCPEDGPPRLPPASIGTIALCAHSIREGLNDIGPDTIEDRLAMLLSLDDPLAASAARQRAVQSHKYGVKVGSLVDLGADVDFGIPGTGTGTGPPDDDKSSSSSSDGRPRFVRKPWMRDNGMVNILPRRRGTKGDADWVVLVGAESPILEQLCSRGELGRWASGFVDDRDPSLWWERRFGARRVPIEDDDDDDHENDEDEEDEDGDMGMDGLSA